MEDVFGSDGFLSNTAFGKGHVFGDVFVEVVANHEHVEVFVYGIDGVGACGVGGGGQYIGFSAQAHNVGCMTATSAFGVVGVNGAPFEGRRRLFYKSRFVEGVGMDGNLNVVVFGNG